MRARINEALKEAMKAKNAARLSTLRLVSAAIKDRDIAMRGEGREDGVNDGEIPAMVETFTKGEFLAAARGHSYAIHCRALLSLPYL